jgi:hypothetical protein
MHPLAFRRDWKVFLFVPSCASLWLGAGGFLSDAIPFVVERLQ